MPCDPMLHRNWKLHRNRMLQFNPILHRNPMLHRDRVRHCEQELHCYHRRQCDEGPEGPHFPGPWHGHGPGIAIIARNCGIVGNAASLARLVLGASLGRRPVPWAEGPVPWPQACPLGEAVSLGRRPVPSAKPCPRAEGAIPPFRIRAHRRRACARARRRARRACRGAGSSMRGRSPCRVPPAPRDAGRRS
jgi:hypothetical protein